MTISDRFRTRRWALAAAAGLLIVGGLAGAAVTRSLRPVPAMAPGAPVAIASLPTLTKPLVGHRIATVRGTVAEIYGNSFILADTSGRTMVSLGRHADPASLVALKQQVTVQGRYADGVLRAGFLVGVDGQVTALGGGRHHGRDHGGRHGRDGDRFGPAGKDQPSGPEQAPPVPVDKQP